MTIVLAAAIAVVFALVPPVTREAAPQRRSLDLPPGLGPLVAARFLFLFGTYAVGRFLVLLVAAGLLIRTSIRIARVDPGFRTEGIVTARVTLPENRYETGDAMMRGFQSIVSAVESSPGITHAAAASSRSAG